MQVIAFWLEVSSCQSGTNAPAFVTGEGDSPLCGPDFRFEGLLVRLLTTLETVLSGSFPIPVAEEADALPGEGKDIELQSAGF